MNEGRKARWILVLTIAFKIVYRATLVDASPNEPLRILSVGVSGESRFTAADLLSGKQTTEQKDGETVTTAVLTDEGRRMTLITGPSLCEKDVTEQSFKTAVFLSSPGPHAVLIPLNDEEASEECDLLKQVQGMLGDEVFKFCIILLNQNQQEHLSGASRALIEACGGRFHMISDSKPKPSQREALVAELDKLVLINGDIFYTKFTEMLETTENIRDINDKSLLSFGWIVLIVINSVLFFIKLDENWSKVQKIFIYVSFMVVLRTFLWSIVAIPLNMALSVTFTTATIFNFLLNPRSVVREATNVGEVLLVGFFFVLFGLNGAILMVALGIIIGTAVSVQTFWDVLVAYHSALGAIFGVLLPVDSLTTSQTNGQSEITAVLLVFCLFGEFLSLSLMTVFTLLGLKMSIFLIILGFAGVLKMDTELISLISIVLIVPACCVIIGALLSVAFNLFF